MKTLKRFVVGTAIDIAFLIPVSAGLALISWFLGQVLIGFPLGGYVNNWKWCYVVTTGLILVLNAYYSASTFFRLWAFSKKIGITLGAAEEAWWDLRFYKYHSDDMWEWDKDTFHSQVQAARIATNLSEIAANWFGNQ